MKVKAYAAKKEKGPLEPYEYELGEIGPDDVDIEIGIGRLWYRKRYIKSDEGIIESGCSFRNLLPTTSKKG